MENDRKSPSVLGHEWRLLQTWHAASEAVQDTPAMSAPALTALGEQAAARVRGALHARAAGHTSQLGQDIV